MTSPSPLRFGRFGCRLVRDPKSSGEEQVTPSVLGFGHEKAPAEAGAEHASVNSWNLWGNFDLGR